MSGVVSYAEQSVNRPRRRAPADIRVRRGYTAGSREDREGGEEEAMATAFPPQGRPAAGAANGVTRRDLLAATALGLAAGAPALAGGAAPARQLTWALHVSVPSTWLDPAETLGIISPFMVLYALHDAMVK